MEIRLRTAGEAHKSSTSSRIANEEGGCFQLLSVYTYPSISCTWLFKQPGWSITGYRRVKMTCFCQKGCLPAYYICVSGHPGCVRAFPTCARAHPICARAFPICVRVHPICVCAQKHCASTYFYCASIKKMGAAHEKNGAGTRKGDTGAELAVARQFITSWAGLRCYPLPFLSLADEKNNPAPGTGFAAGRQHNGPV